MSSQTSPTRKSQQQRLQNSRFFRVSMVRFAPLLTFRPAIRPLVVARKMGSSTKYMQRDMENLAGQKKRGLPPRQISTSQSDSLVCQIGHSTYPTCKAARVIRMLLLVFCHANCSNRFELHCPIFLNPPVAKNRMENASKFCSKCLFTRFA